MQQRPLLLKARTTLECKIKRFLELSPLWRSPITMVQE